MGTPPSKLFLAPNRDPRGFGNLLVLLPLGMNGDGVTDTPPPPALPPTSSCGALSPSSTHLFVHLHS